MDYPNIPMSVLSKKLIKGCLRATNKGYFALKFLPRTLFYRTKHSYILLKMVLYLDFDVII